MHANLFDRYLEGDSFLHRLDPRIKVIGLVAFVVSNAVLPDGAWPGYLAMWALLLGGCALSGLGIFYTLPRSLIALPFALAAISAIFAPTGLQLAHWNIAGLQLIPTDVGLLRFVSILARAWLSVQMGILIVAATPFPDLLHALEHLHFPKSLSTIIAFLYRYLFVVADETYRLLRARDARSAGAAGNKGGNLAWRASVAGNMAGQLFLRSYERSDRIYNAMLSRGYSGNIRTLHPHQLTRKDWLTMFAMLVAIASIQILVRAY